jgi:DNA mismatch repair protein MutL
VGAAHLRLPRRGAAVDRGGVAADAGHAPAEATAGFKLTVEAGVETDAREAGIPVGTQVEVRDLFFNTPARAKFGKSEATETANVSEAMLRLALANPSAHLRLRVSGRVAMDLPPHRDLGERVRAALARRGAGALHEADGEEGGCRVRAFLAGPEESTNTTRNTFLFVGGRFVRDRNLLHALRSATDRCWRRAATRWRRCSSTCRAPTWT